MKLVQDELVKLISMTMRKRENELRTRDAVMADKKVR
jgi:hypothetical protein